METVEIWEAGANFFALDRDCHGIFSIHGNIRGERSGAVLGAVSLADARNDAQRRVDAIRRDDRIMLRHRFTA